MLSEAALEASTSRRQRILVGPGHHNQALGLGPIINSSFRPAGCTSEENSCAIFILYVVVGKIRMTQKFGWRRAIKEDDEY